MISKLKDIISHGINQKGIESMEIERGKYFDTWTEGNVRIMKDKTDLSRMPYELQEYNGKTWNKVKRYAKLIEAKKAMLNR